MPFILSFAVFKALWEVFPSSREVFSRDFGVKIIKLMFYLVQGIKVSSVFIENKLEKYLTDTPVQALCKCTQLPNMCAR